MSNDNRNMNSSRGYCPGMRINFTTPDLRSHRTGTIKEAGMSHVKLNDGTLVNKSLIHPNKEK